MSDHQPTIADLDRAINQMLNENEVLQAENKRLVARLDTLMTALKEERGTLGVLQLIAHDMTLPPGIRIKAAAVAVQFERAKPASTNGTVSINLFDLLETKRRLRTKGAEAKVIEHAPEHDPQPPAA